jgi:hypothetical protein
MPDIDKDLYQLLTLVLLGLGVVLLLAMLSALGGIRKALKQQLERLESLPAGSVSGDRASASDSLGDARADADADDSREPLSEAEPAYSTPSLGEPTASEPDTGTVEPSVTGGFGLGGAQPSGAGAISYPEPSEPEPAHSDASDELAALASDAPETGAGVGEWQPDPERFGTQSEEAGTGSSLEDPFGSALSEASTAGEPAGGASTGAASEPEDQPFERDGKWFFRRGDEFLRYDEATGQWVDADPSETGTVSSTPGAGWSGSEATGSAPAQDETATAEIDSVEAAEPSPQPAAGGFWKCTSCGAVNGASATSCRMCFAQRP